MNSLYAPARTFAGDGQGTGWLAGRFSRRDCEQGVFGCGRRSGFDVRMNAFTFR